MSINNNNSSSNNVYFDRFRKISEKLSTIPLTQEGSRANRIDNFSEDVSSIDEKFNNSVEEYNKKIVGLKEEVFRLQKLVEENSNNFEGLIAARQRQIDSLDNAITQKLENEIVGRRESEAKQLRILEDKVNFLRADISTETKIRSEILNSLNDTLQTDLPKLYDLVKTETEERETSDEIALKKAADEIKKLKDFTQSQKNIREETETTIFDMLKELVNRIKAEIDEERKDREQSQETLVTLLEDAANKLCATAEV